MPELSANESSAQLLAGQFRTDHDQGIDPLQDLFELLHRSVGIDVISMAAPDAEHGLSMSDQVTGRIVIAIATTPHPMRQRSSIAHELGHVLAGDLDGDERPTPGERSPAEIRADGFARHLLLPQAAIRDRITGTATPGDLSDLVQHFQVSPRIAAIQLRTLKLIDGDTCTAWGNRSAASLATAFGWGSQYRALAADSASPRAPQGLMARAVRGYHQGVLGINELAAWYGRDSAELELELGTPPSVDVGIGDDDAPLFPPETQQVSTS